MRRISRLAGIELAFFAPLRSAFRTGSRRYLLSGRFFHCTSMERTGPKKLFLPAQSQNSVRVWSVSENNVAQCSGPGMNFVSFVVQPFRPGPQPFGFRA